MNATIAPLYLQTTLSYESGCYVSPSLQPTFALSHAHSPTTVFASSRYDPRLAQHPDAREHPPYIWDEPACADPLAADFPAARAGQSVTA